LDEEEEEEEEEGAAGRGLLRPLRELTTVSGGVRGERREREREREEEESVSGMNDGAAARAS
jgi:hypothetical protein